MIATQQETEIEELYKLYILEGRYRLVARERILKILDSLYKEYKNTSQTRAKKVLKVKLEVLSTRQYPGRKTTYLITEKGIQSNDDE